MIRKLAKILFLLALIFAGTVVTVADHLFIGIITFIAMIVMVATGPKAGEARELSELEKAKNRSES